MMVSYEINKTGPLAVFGFGENDTTVMVITPIARTICEYGPYFEMFASFVCMSCNLYSALRLINVGTFNTNFRIVMISMNLIVTGIAVFRPVYALVPNESYSIEDGKYTAAVVMYSAAYLHHICTYTFDAKYLILGLERRMAYKLRATYEHSRDRTTVRVFIYMIIFVWIGVTVKAVCLIWWYDGSIDQKVHKAFVMDSTVLTLVGAHVIALIGWVYGYYTFYYLGKQAHRLKYCGNSLSESFTIKEITNVIAAVRPIIIAYRTVVVVGFLVLAIIAYSFFFGIMTESDMYYTALVTFEYMMIDVYNIYASVYMIWKLRPLRKAFVADVSRLFQRRCLISEIEPDPIENYDNAEETKIYFDQLATSWK